MTPIQHGTNVDGVIRYVACLVLCEPGSDEWRIGKQFALLDDRGRSCYLQDLLESADPHSRTGEIASELLAIISGKPRDARRDILCWSTGPRVGVEGTPYCLQLLGHTGPHRSHPDSGFTEEWGEPLCRANPEAREQAWLPDELKAVSS